jgi:hypothetical protein
MAHSFRSFSPWPFVPTSFGLIARAVVYYGVCGEGRYLSNSSQETKTEKVREQEREREGEEIAEFPMSP